MTALHLVSRCLACVALLSFHPAAQAALPSVSPAAVGNAAPLAPPGSVESLPLSPTAIRIYWAAPPGAVSGYRILRDGRPVAEVAPDARAFDDLDLEPGRNYRYQIITLSAPGPPASADGRPLPPSATPKESPPSVAIVERPEPVWPETLRTDVLVIGASSAGVGAAVAAARLGSRVVLLEETTRVGGMVSNGLCSTDLRDVRHASGLFAEFLGRVRAHYGGGDGRRFEPHVANDEMKALLYAEPRLTLFTRVRVERVLMDGRRVIGVVARHLGTGKTAVLLAAQSIDATAEGDVAAAAGCRFRVGREHRSRREPHAGVIHYFRAEDRLLPGSSGHGDRRVMSYAYLIVVKDYGSGADRTIPMPPCYDPKQYEHTLEWPKTWAATSGKLPNNKYEINEHPEGSDLQGINYDYPTAKPERREQIAQQYRDHVMGFLYYLQTVRGLKNLGLADDEFRDSDHFPPLLYVREARRIEGLVTLDETAVTDARQRIQRRSIGIGDYPMDSHAVRPKRDWQSPDMGEGEFWLLKYTPWYQIPFGVMVPRDADGLLVAMAVSATHVGFGTLRMEPVRMALGQAAGTAAHFCAQLGVEPRELPARFLQDKLPAQGLEISFLPDVTSTTPHYAALQFLASQGFFPDAPFQPDAPTTRAEVARWLARFWIMDFGFWVGRTSSTPSAPQLPPLGPGLLALSAQSKSQTSSRAELARWLVGVKGWPLVHPDRPSYDDVPLDSPDAPYIETLAAHRIDARLWSDPPAGREQGGRNERMPAPPSSSGASSSAVYPAPYPAFPVARHMFYPDAPLSHADFAEALFLAARDISPLFGEFPGPAVRRLGPRP